MKTKSKKVVQWILTGIVGLLFTGSAISKLTGGKDALKMAEDIGLNATSYQNLGVIELLSVLLFCIPKSGIIGSILLIAYMGGAIATHLTHGQSIVAPLVIEVIVVVVSAFRFPELTTRLFDSKQK